MPKKDSEQKYMKQLDKYKEAQRVAVPVKKGTGIEKRHIVWGLFISLISFILSILILFLSTNLFKTIQAEFAFVVVLIIITIGVVFDMIGVAVTAADEIPFHSMASKKMKGARQSLMLLKNAPRVSSFCNDVIGDICSVVSGAAGTAIVYRLFTNHGHISVIEAVAGAVIAALTVGGKAFAKNLGISNSNYIIYKAGRFLANFTLRNKRKKSNRS